jgi:hypothetical protein
LEASEGIEPPYKDLQSLQTKTTTGRKLLKLLASIGKSLALLTSYFTPDGGILRVYLSKSLHFVVGRVTPKRGLIGERLRENRAAFLKELLDINQ